MEHPEVDLKKGKQKSFGKACTTVPDNRLHKKTKNKKKVKESINSSIDRNDDDMATVNKKIKITIVGNSQFQLPVSRAAIYGVENIKYRSCLF